MIKSRRMGWAGNVARLGERRGANTVLVLVWKLEEKRSLERHSRIWEDSSEINLKDVRYVEVEWIHLA